MTSPLKLQHFDLMKAAKAFRGDSAGRARGLVRQRFTARSSIRDLRTVVSCAKILQGIQQDPAADIPEDEATVGVSLFTTAVVLYARATKTSSRARATLDVRSKLSAEERKGHDELCRLRDEVIAHFGAGEHLSRPFHKETIVVTEVDGLWYFRFGWDRVNWASEAVNALAILAGRAIEIFDCYSEEKDMEFRSLLERSPDLLAVIAAHPLPADFFSGSTLAHMDDPAAVQRSHAENHTGPFLIKLPTSPC